MFCKRPQMFVHEICNSWVVVFLIIFCFSMSVCMSVSALLLKIIVQLRLMTESNS